MGRSRDSEDMSIEDESFVDENRYAEDVQDRQEDEQDREAEIARSPANSDEPGYDGNDPRNSCGDSFEKKEP